MPVKLPEQTETVPIPDPTALTIEALKTAIQNLKELTFLRISELEKFINTRIDAVNTLKEEKFKELHERLAMVERHRIEAKQDDAKALETAMTAQRELFLQKNQCNEEAAAKAEASFTKQIEAIRKEGSIEREGLSNQIAALKERIDRGGGREEYRTESKGQSNQVVSWIITAAAVVVAVLALFVQQPKVSTSNSPEPPTRQELMNEIRALKKQLEQ